MNLVDGCDTIGAISVGDGGVLLAGVVAKQQHLLVMRGIFWPSDIGQQARGGGATRVVWVAMVDEVDWCGPRERPKSRRENVHTKSVCANVVTSETVHLRNITLMKGAKIDAVLPALPH